MEIELAYNILDILQTIQDAIKQLNEEYSQGKLTEFNTLSMDVWDGLTTVQRIAMQEVQEGSRIRLADACTCALESLKDIKLLVLTHPDKVEWKIRCELLTIVETMTVQLFYWGIVNICPERRDDFYHYLARTGNLGRLNIPEEERKYECDLTIWVQAYNHLDYTKKCVQSILNNWPKDISAELVLYNHGSSDGTKKYFESISGAKVLNVAINGAIPYVATRAIGGKYTLFVSNDVVIGRNSIDNLFRGISEHDDYGWVVPSTPNVSNLQSISLEYSGLDEFNAATNKNNVYDEKKHEQRVRLCNPIQITKTDVWNQSTYDAYEELICSVNLMSFPDDKWSLWFRHHSYKMILAKDAYCHHFGSITLKEEIGEEQKKKEQFYLEGRKEFFELYGVDPWGIGFCYDYNLFQAWDFPIFDHAYVLGINCGLGSNSLKVKEILREKGALDTTLVNCVQDECFLREVKGVSDEAYLIRTLDDIIVKTGRKKYNFIVIEDSIFGVCEADLLRSVLNAGLDYDQLVYKKEDSTWAICKKG